MSGTSDSRAIIRPDLGVVAKEYDEAKDQAGYIGARVLPYCPVAKRAGVYPFVPRKNFLGLQDPRRGTRGGYRQIEYSYEDRSYKTEDRGLKQPVFDDKRAENAMLGIDDEALATQQLVVTLKRWHEYKVSRALSESADIEELAADVPWSEIETSKPLDHIRAAKKLLRDQGIQATHLIVSLDHIESWSDNKALLDRIKYRLDAVGSGVIPLPVLQGYFGLEILVGQAQYDTSPQAQELSLGEIWPSSYAYVAALVPEAEANNIEAFGLGRTLWWQEYIKERMAFDEYRDEDMLADMFRVRNFQDEVLQFPSACIRLTGVWSES